MYINRNSWTDLAKILLLFKKKVFLYVQIFFFSLLLCHCFFSGHISTHAKRLHATNPSTRVTGLTGNFVFSLSGIASHLK